MSQHRGLPAARPTGRRRREREQFAADDYILANLDSVTTCTWIMVTLKVTKT